MSGKAKRIILLYERLQKGPVTIAAIKQWAVLNDININPRQFYRDIEAIQKSLLKKGEVIRVTNGSRNAKTWTLETKGHKIFSQQELQLFTLWKNMAPSVMSGDNQKTIEKIAGLVYQHTESQPSGQPAGVLDQHILKTGFGEFAFKTVNLTQMLSDLAHAIYKRHIVILHKTQAGDAGNMTAVRVPLQFCPVSFISHLGEIYVGGFEKTKTEQKLLILPVNEISDCVFADQHFAIPGALKKLQDEMARRFGIAEPVDEKVYDIELAIDSAIADQIQAYNWHPSQSFHTTVNGQVIMRFQCGISAELVGWLMKWNNHVQVMRPEILRNLVSA